MPIKTDAAGRHSHVVEPLDSGCAACAVEVSLLGGLSDWLLHERVIRESSTIPVADVLEYRARVSSDRRARRY